MFHEIKDDLEFYLFIIIIYNGMSGIVTYLYVCFLLIVRILIFFLSLDYGFFLARQHSVRECLQWSHFFAKLFLGEKIR